MWSEKCGTGRFCERTVEACVAAAHVIAVATVGQPLERVLADRPQHSEAGLTARHRFRPEQVVVQERLDTVDSVELEAARYRLGAVEGEPAGEHAEAREQRLLLCREEVIAPLRCGTKRPVPLGHAGAWSSLEEVESATETLEDRASAPSRNG